MKDFNEQEIYLLNQELDKLKAENEELKKIQLGHSQGRKVQRRKQ